MPGTKTSFALANEVFTAISPAKIAITIFVSNSNLPFIEIHLLAAFFDSVLDSYKVFMINSALKTQ